MIKVRRGSREDLPAVLDLLSRVWDDDYVPHLWLEWAESPSEGLVLVAESDGDIVGTTYVDFMPHGACWFQALRVHPEFRRLGVGSALAQAALDESRTRGRSYAYLGIDAENTASLNMTARLGFRQITEYTLLSLTLPPWPTGMERPKNTATWCKASLSDLPRLLTAAREAKRADFIACWQWQPLSSEALQENIEQDNIWFWDDPSAFVFAGFEDSESHPHLFDPCGQPEAVKQLIDFLTVNLRREEETRFEVWLRHDSPLVEFLLHQRGFVEQEGYTIWEYPLQPLQ
jgi:GNAT superfamily N-acetyltransferase